MGSVNGPVWTDGNDGRYAGRYPLAVERHAMARVAQLLPGITTVTSHARYYTLHSLVFAEAQVRGLDGDATRQLFRRAEVVVGAASIAHSNAVGHPGLRGVHGAERIGPKVASGAVDLETLAADGGYVQAGWGFWGPYVGPEYTLGLLEAGDRRNTVPGPNADLTALRSGFDGLFDLTDCKVLTREELDAASRLCICQGGVSADGALMRRLLLPATVEPMHRADRRSQSLRMLLRLTELRGGVMRPEVELQKALVFGPERKDAVVAGLDATAAWTGVVLRNELVADWRNLWAYLVEAIDGFMAIEALGEALADRLPAGTLGGFAEDLPDGLDAFGDPVDAAATLDRRAMGRPTHTLARLIIGANRYGRLEDRAAAYFQADRDEQFQQLTPEWTKERIAEWSDRSLRDFAVWLTRQLVARAERVALAKASFDRKSGRFKVPTRVFVRDGHIFRDSTEGGGGVALRWDSAFQIMAGAGLVEYVDERWQVTPRWTQA